MMNRFDVFNGDADGICALIQLRLETPSDTQLITGVKRDISLLKQVPANEASEVTALDISMAKNLPALNNLLESGVPVTYVDHHDPGTIPEHPQLTHHIHTASNTCTSLIVDKLLKGKYREWALVGAYGDNMLATANALISKSSLSDNEAQQLEKLGVYANYNGYGASEEDLHFYPADLYRHMVQFSSPLAFLNECQSVFEKLESGYVEDNSKASAINAFSEKTGSRAFMLPDEAWARRVSGVFSNALTNQDADTANAVITERHDGSYLVSIRAPLTNRTGANELASSFPTGGGRQAAAGINALPADQLDAFLAAFHQRYHRS
ncbi:acetyltransferase [Veronia nyctiphanis]|uniref:Acetyltransferase n=1 Tax=Veronia nyctiphanis TaxID=1278244 RepID=A0A4Q0YS76_9GAMM|nr:DHH family phosphoesterase [Veronia nyctiphanis]RXJ71959.1 acetyltransferase [Veronia nyctiphanis]